ncbi:hypothetical protein RCL1_008245 [Eukaryota sp. TZLM3-RCL]
MHTKLPSESRLTKEFRHFQEFPIEGVHFELQDDDIYHWNVTIVGPVDTFLENGLLKASMVFPKTFPVDPPVFKFTNFFHHPNIYPSGEVGISILHPSNNVSYSGGYTQNEVWTAALGPEAIVISIISLLIQPDLSLCANLDAAIEFRENRSVYEEKIREIILCSWDE